MSEGGYLVPHYIYQDKPGIKAWLFRWLGKLFHNNMVYKKGFIEIDFYAALLDPAPRKFTAVRFIEETKGKRK